MRPFTLTDFIRESNMIEGQDLGPTVPEIFATGRFLRKTTITVDDLCLLVSAYEPNASLRDQPGMDVRVGRHVPPPGGPEIRRTIETLLSEISKAAWKPWRVHLTYESLHPFTDGNGRSGRALWLWMMGGIEKAPLGFLHTFYYQTLQETR